MTLYVPEKTRRKEINVLLAVERATILEACKMQAVCHLPAGLGESLIVAEKHH